jgi:hypothetical protein
MTAEIIDIWNAKTFTEDIHAFLTEHSETIIRFHRYGQQADENLESLQRYERRNRNPFADNYNRIRDKLVTLISTKTIRAFHYTRMVDDEVAHVWSNGFFAPSSDTAFAHLSDRVRRLVETGILSIQEGDRIFSASPLNQPNQLKSRQGFWMTTIPITPQDHSISLLVNNWGGEVGYFWLDESQDPELLTRVQSIGRGRIFEMAVPMSDKDGRPLPGCWSAAKDIVNVLARSHGFHTDNPGFDLSVKSTLPASAVITVHTEGDETYSDFGQSLQNRAGAD